jgi:hypothetical protein
MFLAIARVEPDKSRPATDSDLQQAVALDPVQGRVARYFDLQRDAA